jgi:hypothetical protein
LNQQPHAGAQHAGDLTRRRRAVLDMVQDQVHQRQITAGGRQRDRLGPAAGIGHGGVARRPLGDRAHPRGGLDTVDGPPNVAVSRGVNRPVPEPRSATVNGRLAGAWAANTSIYVAIAASGWARPGAQTACWRWS